MNRRQRGESLSERLRSEVQVSAALWQIGPSVDEKAATGDMKTGGSSRSRVFANIACTGDGFPCPREVKPLLFFYKYLQPIGLADGVGDNNGGVSGNNNSHRKLRVNLPLTVVCERTNAQEMVLWLRTDAQGNVVREEKTPLWRKKLHNDLVGVASPTAANPSSSHDNDPVLAVRSVARWKNSSISGGGSAVVLTRRTLDPVLAAPCELPICIQQFVHCRGSQASVYRIFWCEQERKCFAVNLTSSLKSTEAPEDVDGSANVPPAPTTTVSSSGLSASTMAAMNAAFDAAMVTAAQVSRFYCVTVSPDARACARWPKLRGAAIADGVQATSRVVEHVQLQLPTMRFHSMTVDFIKDTAGVWWLTRIVDFTASSCVEPPRDDVSFSTRDSAVLIPEALRTKSGRHEPQMDDASSPPRELILTHGEVANNAPNARICFLCGFTCELTAAFRNELQMMLKGQNGDEYKARSTIPIDPPAVDEYRMTLTMALDTIFLMRQRGVALPVWENAVSTVRKSLLRDVCDFPVCMLCYRIFQQQNRLQLIACELHSVLSPTTSSNDRPEVDDDLTNGSGAGVGMATSAASGLSASQLLSTELRCCQETPKSILAPLEAYRTETIPPTLLLRGDSPEMRPTWSVLTPMRGADVDPTATQLRLVFLFHELQDAGPDLVPTDFFLEYQLGQSVTRVQLEGSKRHTPNRWQLCEARVHYLCATLDAFSEFCSHKRLLIKMKAKRSSPTRNQRLNDGPIGSESYEKVETGGDDNLNKRDGGDQNGFRDKEEFFGYTLLSLRAVNTAAKWFGNSLQPESRTDFLLELHTASHGLLTLKLTVGLLVDPVPLSRVRDVLRDRVFLEEQPPRGVYWPPPTHFLGGLAVPRDWIGALMPSEYTKILPRRRREAPKAHTSASSPPRRFHTNQAVAAPTPSSLTRRSSANPVEKADSPSNPSVIHLPDIQQRTSMSKNWEQIGQESVSAGIATDGLAAERGIATSEQVQSEYKSRSLHLMTVAMKGTTLSRACLAARRIVFRVTEDSATNTFPTRLLAAILRHASFANSVSTFCSPSSSTWKYPARFHFTRRYSVDRLLDEVKPGNLPVLALLGELLLVLIEDRALPATVDANALEPLLEPFWQQDSGWQAIPRTQSGSLPERRVIWNRAIRRWEAASGDPTVSGKVPQLLTSPENTDTAVTLATQGHAIALAMDIGDFRAKSLALVLCELFEQMETLDNGYIEIAELRSLAKCLPEEEYLCGEEQLDPEVGMRERLSHDNIVALAALVEQQRRLAGQTLLHSLMESAVMADAVARFDRIGYSEMSLEEFRELAAEALISQRKVFCAFLEEPKKSQDGFCLRHGFTELYATDSVCVLCASEYQVEKSSGKPTNSPEQGPEKEQLTTVTSNETGTAVDVVRTARDAFSGERALSGRDIGVETFVRLDQDLDPETTRRASSPPRLERLSRLSSGKTVLHEGHTDAGHDERPQRRRALAARTATTREMVDSELDSMLGRLHAAERTIVIGETQVNERKQSMSGTRTRQSSTSASEAMQHSDLADLAKTAARRATVVKEAGRSPDQSGHEKATKAKKRMKKRILKKTARRLKPTNPLPTSASLSKLLRMEFSDRKRTMTTSASETIIEKAVRVEEKRKQLDRLVLAEVQEVKRRLAKLLDED